MGSGVVAPPSLSGAAQRGAGGTPSLRHHHPLMGGGVARRTDAPAHSKWRKSDELNTCATMHCTECQSPKPSSRFLPSRTSPDGLVARFLHCVLAEAQRNREHRKRVKTGSTVRKRVKRPTEVRAQKRIGDQSSFGKADDANAGRQNMTERDTVSMPRARRQPTPSSELLETISV